MQPKSPFTQPFEKLPRTLPVCPLENALLPGGELPLEFHEPRHLNLVRDAIRGDQLIGMIQPRDRRPEPALHPVGCAGRIRQFRERKSGRIDVMLSGVCRYRVIEEIATTRGYRLVSADWSEYAHDYETAVVDPARIRDFQQALQDYFQRRDMGFDWTVLQRLEIEEVVNNLILVLKLTTGEKQQLLEAATVSQRLDVFRKIVRPPVERASH